MRAPGDPGSVDSSGGAIPPPREPRTPRPWVERVGLAAIATVLAVMFGGVAASAWIGCLMTAWVGGLTLFRG